MYLPLPVVLSPCCVSHFRYVFADFNGNAFTLTNTNGSWQRDSFMITNKPKDPFLVSSVDIDSNDQLYILGFLNKKEGLEGAIYKIAKN